MAWTTKEHDAVVKMLAVVCELTNTDLSEAAKKVVLRQLEAYPSKQVSVSLERCAAECKGRLTLADVISRLDDGRPGEEEAWSSFPKTEDDAGLVTDEMSAAWGAAATLYETDKVGARMAFKECYSREVRKARTENVPVKWRVSPGFNKKLTEGVAIDGLRRGLISEHQALEYIPPESREHALYVAGRAERALPAREEMIRIKQLVQDTLRSMDAPKTNPVPFNERGEK